MNKQVLLSVMPLIAAFGCSRLPDQSGLGLSNPCPELERHAGAKPLWMTINTAIEVGDELWLSYFLTADAEVVAVDYGVEAQQIGHYRNEMVKRLAQNHKFDSFLQSFHSGKNYTDLNAWHTQDLAPQNDARTLQKTINEAVESGDADWLSHFLTSDAATIADCYGVEENRIGSYKSQTLLKIAQYHKFDQFLRSFYSGRDSKNVTNDEEQIEIAVSRWNLLFNSDITSGCWHEKKIKGANCNVVFYSGNSILFIIQLERRFDDDGTPYWVVIGEEIVAFP